MHSPLRTVIPEVIICVIPRSTLRKSEHIVSSLLGIMIPEVIMGNGHDTEFRKSSSQVQVGNGEDTIGSPLSIVAACKHDSAFRISNHKIASIQCAHH